MQKIFSSILLRTPLQSLSEVFSFENGLDPVFEEGLYLSSGDFWKEFLKREHLLGKDKEKMTRSFAKYWIRSCMRSTPFGTFAGSKLLSITQAATNITLDYSQNHTRKLRIDMNYLTQIIQSIAQLPAIQKQLKFYPNNSLYQLSDSFRYAEYIIENNTRKYELTSVNKEEILSSILDIAKQGCTIGTLVALVENSTGVNNEDAVSFIDEVISSQLLISELEPPVTGIEPLAGLIGQLTKFNGTDSILEKLTNIQFRINNPQEGVLFYQQTEELLKKSFPEIDTPKNTLQCDLFLSVGQSLINEDLVRTIVNQVEDLKSLSRVDKNLDLDNFKKKFIEKYEDAEQPFSIVLDADLGLGYANIQDQLAGGSALIDNLAVGSSSGTTTTDYNYVQPFVSRKYYEYLREGKDNIEITESELNWFKEQLTNINFPSSMYIMGSLLKNQEKIDKENFVFDLSSYSGPSGANLLGRFTSGNEEVRDFVYQILQKEEEGNPDALFAEVAHLPEARIGNILLRPVLRKYEIPYVGKSGADDQYQIPLDDLMIGVKNSQVVLRSKKHNKRVIPRLTTAHNYNFKSLPAYKFLCDLQAQGIAYPNQWDWGLLISQKHLPRVIYKNIVLQKARWIVEEKDIADLPTDKNEYGAYFDTLINQLRIPCTVVFKEGDNELLIDFKEEKCLDLLVHFINKKKSVVLEEFLFDRNNCPVSNMDNAPFCNELIIPVYQEKEAAKEELMTIGHGEKLVQRKFSPMSQWLYFKIYCGSKTAEIVLRDTIREFVETGIEEKFFEKFFFLRYRDDASHIRIRFFNLSVEKQQDLYKRFMESLQPLLDNDTVSKVMVDTYNRELERYGPYIIEESETLFFYDSLAVLRFVKLLEGNEGDKYRLLFALRGIDMLLSDFRLNLMQKKAIMIQLQTGYLKEFGDSALLKKQLNEKYRNHQSDIFSHLDIQKDAINEIEDAVSVFKIRSEMNEAVIMAILEKINNNHGQLVGLLASYIHMFVNRLYIAQQRKYELVVYYFLERYYTSQVAIQKSKIS